ncbi:MAG: exodeoxyribonuclease VII small subunit [Christensenellaceae bacterium]|jgi:exodeoxyribonuclease VII small subunit|nr:exodeoxyribonuclease VII small subunit [Christensenellaceae bacterium]
MAQILSFEEKCKRLEQIVSKLEDPNLSLSEGTKIFEEGVKLSKECYAELEGSKGKIVVIKKELDKIVDDTDN